MTDAQIAGGHKASLKNPNASEQAKQHSKSVLDNEFNSGNVPRASEDESGNNPGNSAGGLKATMNNPKASEEAKQSAQDRVKKM